MIHCKKTERNKKKQTDIPSMCEMGHHFQVIPAGILMAMQCCLDLGHCLKNIRECTKTVHMTKADACEIIHIGSTFPILYQREIISSMRKLVSYTI